MFSEKRLFLFDIDGTIALGDELIPGARELLGYIESIGGRAMYISNNSTKSRVDYVDRFERVFGLKTVPGDFVTASHASVLFLKEHHADDTIFIVGTRSFVDELRAAGLDVTEQVGEGIGCVLVGFDNELTYEKAAAACEVLQTTSAAYYATNPDLRCPVPFGFVPDCGAICRLIEAATDRVPQFLGKPSRGIVELCLAELGFSRAETLVVGDRLYTDIACANNAGVDSCLVFTGEAKPEDLDDTLFAPTRSFESVAQLLDSLRR